VHIQSQFAELKYSKKIWAVGSIHSHIDSFNSIKEHILRHFVCGDKLVFLGNIIGFGKYPAETLSSAIKMRNDLLSKFLLKTQDIVFLRGAQEEMFLKLLQLQTAPNPQDIVLWMFEHGVDKTACSYGFNKEEIINISTQGILSISRWTAKLNKIIDSFPGHKEYFSNLRHAAFSDTKKILFVNRGVDISRPLSAQSDCFWWGYQNFSKLNKPYYTFKKIVRGYDPLPSNSLDNIKNKVICSLFKAPLSDKNVMAGLFSDSGKILDLFESK
jgi:hypothetical protein|tara:strand:- start:1144 stop:1956 length:813 start_codon:yes stop_codon:yes gene_type:complete